MHYLTGGKTDTVHNLHTLAHTRTHPFVTTKTELQREQLTDTHNNMSIQGPDRGHQGPTQSSQWSICDGSGSGNHRRPHNVPRYQRRMGSGAQTHDARGHHSPQLPGVRPGWEGGDFVPTIDRWGQASLFSGTRGGYKSDEQWRDGRQRDDGLRSVESLKWRKMFATAGGPCFLGTAGGRRFLR